MFFTGCTKSKAYAPRSTQGFLPRNRPTKVSRSMLRCGVWRLIARWKAGQSQVGTARKVTPEDLINVQNTVA